MDFAQLVKIYGPENAGAGRYSPPACIGCETHAVTGSPDDAHIRTNDVERQNLTMRVSMRRFTRLTNGASKKAENHEVAVALHYMHYNLCQVYQPIRVTPVMHAGLADHVWGIPKLVALLD